MTANCTRCSGRQSMLAPTSSQTEGPFRLGTTAHKAGRSTPSRTPQVILTVAITAPVFPALTTPEARPSRTRVAATLMEESFLRRNAVTGDSSIPTASLACTISIGNPSARCLASSVSMSLRRPTRIRCAPYSRAARTDPATGWAGAKSPPIASMAILISTQVPSRARTGPAGRARKGPPGMCRMGSGRRGAALRGPASDLADLDDLPPLVIPAVRADPVRQLVLLAVRTLRRHSRARVTSFRVRHRFVLATLKEVLQEPESRILGPHLRARAGAGVEVGSA